MRPLNIFTEIKYIFFNFRLGMFLINRKLLFFGLFCFREFSIFFTNQGEQIKKNLFEYFSFNEECLNKINEIFPLLYIYCL